MLAYLLFTAASKTPASHQLQQLRTEVRLLFDQFSKSRLTPLPGKPKHQPITAPAPQAPANPELAPTAQAKPGAESGASVLGEGIAKGGQPGATRGTDAAPLPLNLSLPSKALRDKERPIAELATHDRRSNRIRLTPRERFAISMGEYECVGEERMPDGLIRRGPGKLAPVKELGGDAISGKLVMECRF